MRKSLCVFIVLTMLLSLSAPVLADTFIRYTFMDTDGYIYHFGTFDNGDTDAGVVINGKEYTLKNTDKNDETKTAFDVAKENGNKFGIGFKAGANFEDETYSVTPYAKDANGNRTLGIPVTVNKNEYQIPVETVVANSAVTDDAGQTANIQTGDFSNTDRTDPKDDMYIVRNDGKNPGGLNQWGALLKIDLTKFADASSNSNYTLYLNGTTREYGGSGSCNLDTFKVGVVGVPDLAWSEADTSNIELLYNSITYTYANNQTVIDYVTLPKADSEAKWYGFNLTGYIQSELAKDKTSTTVVIFADNTIPAANASEAYRNAFAFDINSLQSETKPYITYEKASEEYSEAELKTLTVGGESVDLSKAENNALNYYLPYGTETMPEITAEAEGSYATVTVDYDVNKVESQQAVVTVTSGDKANTYTFTVNVVIMDKESQSSSRTLKYADASTVSGANVSAGLNAGSMNSNLKYIQFGNIMGTENGYSDKVALMELDLNKIKDEIDKSKSITISTNAKLRAHYVFSGDIAIYESKKQVSQITELAQLSDIDSIIDINNPISETKVTMDSAGYTSATWDITEFVIECLEKGVYKPVIAFYVPDGFTTTDSTKRSQFTIYIQNYGDTQLNYWKLQD